MAAGTRPHDSVTLNLLPGKDALGGVAARGGNLSAAARCV